MTNQPADLWASSLSVFSSAYCKPSAHLALEVLVFLFPAARVAHTLPWIAAYGHSLSSRLHSPPLFLHPLTHWRKAWGPSVVEGLLLDSQAAIFSSPFFLKTQSTGLLTQCLSHSLVLSPIASQVLFTQQCTWPVATHPYRKNDCQI